MGELADQRRGQLPDRGADEVAETADLVQRPVDRAVDQRRLAAGAELGQRRVEGELQTIADFAPDRADQGAGRDLPGERVAAEDAPELRAEDAGDVAEVDLRAVDLQRADRAAIGDLDVVIDPAAGVVGSNAAVPGVLVGRIKLAYHSRAAILKNLGTFNAVQCISRGRLLRPQSRAADVGDRPDVTVIIVDERARNRSGRRTVNKRCMLQVC